MDLILLFQLNPLPAIIPGVQILRSYPPSRGLLHLNLLTLFDPVQEGKNIQVGTYADLLLTLDFDNMAVVRYVHSGWGLYVGKY